MAYTAKKNGSDKYIIKNITKQNQTVKLSGGFIYLIPAQQVSVSLESITDEVNSKVRYGWLSLEKIEQAPIVEQE